MRMLDETSKHVSISSLFHSAMSALAVSRWRAFAHVVRSPPVLQRSSWRGSVVAAVALPARLDGTHTAKAETLTWPRPRSWAPFQLTSEHTRLAKTRPQFCRASRAGSLPVIDKRALLLVATSTAASASTPRMSQSTALTSATAATPRGSGLAARIPGHAGGTAQRTHHPVRGARLRRDSAHTGGRRRQPMRTRAERS